MAAIGKIELKNLALDLNRLAEKWGDIQGLVHENRSKREVSQLILQGNELVLAKAEPQFINTDTIPDATLDKLNAIIELARDFKTSLHNLGNRLIELRPSLNSSARAIFKTQFEKINSGVSEYLDPTLKPLSYKLESLQGLHPVAAPCFSKQKAASLDNVPGTSSRVGSSTPDPILFDDQDLLSNPFATQEDKEGSSMESTTSEDEVNDLASVNQQAPVQLNPELPEALLNAFAGSSDKIALATTALGSLGGQVILDDYGFAPTAIDALYLDLVEQLLGLAQTQPELKYIETEVAELDDTAAIQWIEDHFETCKLIPQLALKTLQQLATALQPADQGDY